MALPADLDVVITPEMRRIEMASHLSRFPFSGGGTTNGMLHNFRVAGTYADYLAIIDHIAKEVQDFTDRANKQAEEQRQLIADVAAVRRLFDWRKIDG